MGLLRKPSESGKPKSRHPDLPIAEEAAVTAELMGNRIDRLYDAASPACIVS